MAVVGNFIIICHLVGTQFGEKVIMVSSDFPWLGKVHPTIGHWGVGGSGGLAGGNPRHSPAALTFLVLALRGRLEALNGG